MPHQMLHTIHYHVRQRLLRPIAVIHPARQLRVPHQRVAAQELVVFSGYRGRDRAVGVVEHVLCGLRVHPFLLIGGRELTELLYGA
jgi:hypothetical protein